MGFTIGRRVPVRRPVEWAEHPEEQAWRAACARVDATHLAWCTAWNAGRPQAEVDALWAAYQAAWMAVERRACGSR